jgi:hypothetical protein
MANPSVVSLQLVAAVANGVAQAQTPGAAGNLTLNGSLVTNGVATFDVARRVAVASTGSDAGVVFTVTGTDRNGNKQADTVTGLNASSGFTTRDFLTVTQISVSGATAGAVTAGTNGTASTEWVVDNFLAHFWALAVAVSVSQANGVTYSVEHTYDDPTKGAPSLSPAPAQASMEASSNSPALAWVNPMLAQQQTNAEANYANQPIFAHRLTITNGTARATMQSIQAGIT